MAVEYTSAPCGAYRELLFIPGTMRFDDGRRYASISRILVSTWASVVNGRANWGIPKDLAAFSIERGADRDVVAVGDGHRQCCRLEFEPPRGPRLPLSTRWLPPSWRTLAQVRDGRTYYYELRAQGSLRPARLVHWWFDPQHVPDLTSATVLATVRVEAFRMEFPVARVDDALRPARTDAPAGPRP
jgi:hypothetical protein